MNEQVTPEIQSPIKPFQKAALKPAKKNIFANKKAIVGLLIFVAIAILLALFIPRFINSLLGTNTTAPPKPNNVNVDFKAIEKISNSYQRAAPPLDLQKEPFGRTNPFADF